MPTSDRLFSQYSSQVLVGNGVAFTILPMIFVALRFYARRVARAAVGIDDCCIVLALVRSELLFVPYSILTDLTVGSLHCKWNRLNSW